MRSKLKIPTYAPKTLTILLAQKVRLVLLNSTLQHSRAHSNDRKYDFYVMFTLRLVVQLVRRSLVWAQSTEEFSSGLFLSNICRIPFFLFFPVYSMFAVSLSPIESMSTHVSSRTKDTHKRHGQIEFKSWLYLKWRSYLTYSLCCWDNQLVSLDFLMSLLLILKSLHTAHCTLALFGLSISQIFTYYTKIEFSPSTCCTHKVYRVVVVVCFYCLIITLSLLASKLSTIRTSSSLVAFQKLICNSAVKVSVTWCIYGRWDILFVSQLPHTLE